MADALTVLVPSARRIRARSLVSASFLLSFKANNSFRLVAKTLNVINLALKLRMPHELNDNKFQAKSQSQRKKYFTQGEVL